MEKGTQARQGVHMALIIIARLWRGRLSYGDNGVALDGAAPCLAARLSDQARDAQRGFTCGGSYDP